MHQILVLLAHPQFQYSHVNAAMIGAIDTLSHVRIHDLYETYPHFYIDIPHEQEALRQAHTLVLQFPFQWYSCPSLMKEWMDVVMQKGFAYGEGKTALQGKRLLVAITVGGPEESYSREGYNRFTMGEFLVPFAQIAHLCGMEFLPPLIFHNALRAQASEIQAHALHYRTQLSQLEHHGATHDGQ